MTLSRWLKRVVWCCCSGDLMLETVCQQLKAFNSKAIDGFSIAVNISSEQFTAALVDRLDQLISEYDLQPEQIGLEITESVAMKAIDSNLKLLETFRQREDTKSAWMILGRGILRWLI